MNQILKNTACIAFVTAMSFSQAHANKPLPPGVNYCTQEQTAEAGRDAAMRSVVAQIETMNQTIEHGAFIVNDNGTYRALRIVSGNADGILITKYIDSLIGTFYNLDQVVGMVHSHPLSLKTFPGQADLENRLNRAPSDNDFNAIADDTSPVSATIKFFLTAQGANYETWRQSFAHYIISPQAELAEFDSETRNSGTIVRYGAAYYKNTYYTSESFDGGTFSVISKFWHGLAKSDAASSC